MDNYAEVLKNVSLKKYNTYGIDTKTKYLVMPNSKQDVLNVLNYLNNNHIPYYVLGNGSNILLPDNDYNGAIIKLNKLNKIEIKNNILKVEAGVLLPYLNQKLLNLGYVNFYWASSIPGEVGGSIHGNAGAYKHDIFENLISIEIIQNNKIITLNKEDIKYGYRYTNLNNCLILSATFNLVKGDINTIKEEMKLNLKKRMKTQPLDELTAGSVFKNPEGYSAGKLIEDLGLKGKVIGGAKVSEKHANFIVNFNKAKASDIISLINLIQEKVLKENNINLELEQIIVKW
jgi:UDP-N-acetylmuramate dehydrogenase